MRYLISNRAKAAPSVATACEQVSVQYAQTTLTAKSLLETLIRNHSLISLDYMPLETFAKEQSVRQAHDVLRRLSFQVLTRENLLEHMENIIASFKLYQCRLSLEGAVMALKCLKVFMTTVADLCFCLEYLSGQPPTNWDDCARYCDLQLRGLRIRSAYNAVEFVPRVQDFQVVRTLGGGGFGVVYEAIHIPTDLRVCIKLIITSRLKRLSYAALDKIVASVAEHPKLVQYHASFLTTQAYATVMEYVGGVDVLKFVTSIGEVIQLPGHYCVILNQMVKAVAHIHANGFLHRDIKPQNALLLPGGHIKLIDFDTCKICVAHFVDSRPLPGYFSRTAVEYEDREYAGTLAYMPPEVIDRRPYGRAIDWWAIGVTAYRLVVGKMPFREKDRDRLKDSIRRANIRLPEWVGQAEKDFIVRLLARDPNNRLGSETYVELVQHPVFDFYNAEKPFTEAYFDTSKINELLKKKAAKKIRAKTRERQYMELKDCGSVPTEEQKNLLVFASIPWRLLIRPEEQIVPNKTDAEAERDLETLLDAPELLAADTFPSSWGANDLWQQNDISTSTSGLGLNGSSLSLSSRLHAPLDELVKPVEAVRQSGGGTTYQAAKSRDQSKKRAKKKACSIV